METENYAFWISYKTDNRLFADKLTAFHEQTLSILNQLNINQYSISIKKIVLFCIVYSPTTQLPERDKISYLRKKQKLEIYFNMDYQQLLNANKDEVRQVVAETYLAAINRFLRNRKDFDYPFFYQDTENLFIKNGYLPEKKVDD